MNPSPRKNGEFLTNYGCGFLAMENRARSFWQSRATKAGRPASVPALTNIAELATAIRLKFNEERK